MTEPTRTCRVCRTPLPQSQLNRWTLIDGVPTLDQASRAAGRGYYSCPEVCTEKLLDQPKRYLRR